MTATRQTTVPIEHTNFSPTFQRASALVRQVNEGHLDLRPPYQRGSVWTSEQQVSLVESWLRGVPTGTVVFADRINNIWRGPDGQPAVPGTTAMYACIDGQQRITTAIRWFRSEFAVPASWFKPEWVAQTELTDDGPYVRHSGLTKAGMNFLELRASIQIAEARTCASIADEARIYLLLNEGGTSQTSADLDNARRVASGG
jgi:uncharacterized protein DUF262